VIVAPLRTIVVPVVRRRFGIVLVLALLVAVLVPSGLAGDRTHGDQAGHLAHASTLVMPAGVSEPSVPSPVHPLRTPVRCHGHDDCPGLPLWLHPHYAVSSRVAPGLPTRATDRTAVLIGAVREAPSLAALGVLRV